MSDTELAKLIMSWAFGETQPNRGDVFAWLDDHVEDLARFLNKRLSPSAPVAAQETDQRKAADRIQERLRLLCDEEILVSGDFVMLRQAADRIDELEDVLRDATEAESLLKPEQRSPWFTKALTVLSALTPKVPT